MPTEDDENECRICRGGPEVAALLHPCKCSGSIRYVHEECIKLWLLRTRAKTCELCKHPFKFSPVYAPDTPSRLPTSIFLLGFLRIIGKHLQLLLRLGLVILLWVVCLPIGTSWMCRVFFARSFQGLLLLKDRLQSSALVGDWIQGLLLSILVVGVFLAISALRDYLVRADIEPAAQHNPPPAPLQEMAGNIENQIGGVEAVHAEHEADRPPALQLGLNDGEGAAVPAAVEPANGALGAPDEARGADWDQGDMVGQDEVPLEEFLGLRGPIRHMVENAVTALVSNGLFIGLLTLVPFSVGRIALFLKVQLSLLLRKGAAAPANVPNYSDGVTLLIGYACIIVITLDLVLVSLVAGKRLQWTVLSVDSPLMRHLLSMVRYAFLLSKVALLLGVELVLFPLCCGWLLDACALPLLDASWQDRVAFASAHPVAAQVLHWVLGVLFMLHLSVIVAVLREVLRPEVLWFLRNPADPEEHPFRDLVDEPLVKHTRRLVLSLLLYAPLTLLLVHAPVLLVRALFPALLPLRLGLHNPFVDLSPALVLAHLSLPFLMDQLRPRDSFKMAVEWWLGLAAGGLAIQDRILPTPPPSPTVHAAAPPSPQAAPPLMLAPDQAAAEVQAQGADQGQGQGEGAQAPSGGEAVCGHHGVEGTLEAQVGAAVAPLVPPLQANAGTDAPEPDQLIRASGHGGNDEPAHRATLSQDAAVEGGAGEAGEVINSSHLVESGEATEVVDSVEAEVRGAVLPEASLEMHLAPQAAVEGATRHGGRMLWVRISLLLLMGACTSVLVVAFTLVVPLTLGRAVLWPVSVVHGSDGGWDESRMDMYAFAIGFLLSAMGVESAVGACQRFGWTLASWAAVGRGLATHLAAAAVAWCSTCTEGWPAVREALKPQCARLLVACELAAASVLLPLGLGLLVDATLCFLFRVTPLQSPAVGPLAAVHWLVGVAVVKMMLRIQPERLPLRPGVDPLVVLRAVAWDAVRKPQAEIGPDEKALLKAVGLGLRAVAAAVSVPYAVMIGLLPVVGVEVDTCWTLWRGVYPVTVGNLVIIAGGWRAFRSLGRMHDAIRDSIYLVGRRLHNLEAAGGFGGA